MCTWWKMYVCERKLKWERLMTDGSTQESTWCVIKSNSGMACNTSWTSWTAQPKRNGQFLPIHCHVNIFIWLNRGCPLLIMLLHCPNLFQQSSFRTACRANAWVRKKMGPVPLLSACFYQKRQYPLSLPTVFISFGAKWSLVMGCPFPQVHSTPRMKMLLLRIFMKRVMDSWGNFRIKVSQSIPQLQKIADAECRVLSTSRGS